MRHANGRWATTVRATSKTRGTMGTYQGAAPGTGPVASGVPDTTETQHARILARGAGTWSEDGREELPPKAMVVAVGLMSPRAVVVAAAPSWSSIAHRGRVDGRPAPPHDWGARCRDAGAWPHRSACWCHQVTRGGAVDGWCCWRAQALVWARGVVWRARGALSLGQTEQVKAAAGTQRGTMAVNDARRTASRATHGVAQHNHHSPGTAHRRDDGAHRRHRPPLRTEATMARPHLAGHT